MRYYVIDQLAVSDVSRLCACLDEMGLRSSVEGLYWLPVPADLYSDLQKEHQATCGGYSMALEILEESLSLELLVRGMGRMRCECLGFASVSLRNHMIAYLDGLLGDLNIEY